MRISVLGGSTPFVTTFFEELAARDGELPAIDVALHGRNPHHLDLVRRYAEAAFVDTEWTVDASLDMVEVLAAADIVMQQIRFGQLEGRHADEQLAASLGAVADETLGPGGLNAAIRQAPGLRRVGETIRAVCPEAFVVNLTNPLSLTTTLLHELGCRPMGICELPEYTVAHIAAVFGLEFEDLDWDYAGLNHRGYVFRAMAGGRDLIAALPDQLGDRTIIGITGEEIVQYGAVPTKYHTMYRGTPEKTYGRAAQLIDMRARALRELDADPTTPPPSVRERNQPWYSDAVVPLIVSLTGAKPGSHVLSLVGEDGIASEVRATVDTTGVVGVAKPDPPAHLRPWLDADDEHERRSFRAMLHPTAAHIRAALESDRLTPNAVVDRATQLIMAGL